MTAWLLSPARLKVLWAGTSAVLLIALGVTLLAASHLSGQLNTERAGHDVTREKLATAVREGNRWKAVADTAQPIIAALQGSASECLAREAQATADAAERAAIMESAQPRERTPAESKGVVDDATRRTVMDRLNRPL